MPILHEDSAEKVTLRASAPSVVQFFEITGLHGSKQISLSSPYSATVLIAKNGSGKTTLLGALDAFLRAQFTRLQDLEFQVIRCKVRHYDEDLILSRKDILEFSDVSKNDELASAAKSFDTTPREFMRFLIEEYSSLATDYANIFEHKIFSQLGRAFDWEYEKMYSYCDKMKESCYETNAHVFLVYTVLRNLLADIEIVYLPTYRRIELAMAGDVKQESVRGSKKFRVLGRSLFTGEIQFGLADIAERLASLHRKILIDSNSGYRKISADILNDLASEYYENETTPDDEIPNFEDLDLFFLRIKEGLERPGPYSDVTIPDLDKISERMEGIGETSKFLRYFLAKLGEVIKTTRDIEHLVELFIRTCNRYLLADDLSTLADLAETPLEIEDGKRLRFSRLNLKVDVESVPDGRRMSLDALSSGEKQMVSLFAKMYLYPRQKIVLIDEPELSLSIDWQRNILLDVLTAPQCVQLIAITHSPFVFDNELEPFAKSVSYSRKSDVTRLTGVKGIEING